jgi:NAD(P)-dependent dehydrogenase (short-subunit alcohol dehydrogenase family)
MKRILITGATSGIGEALARHAASQGHSIIACGRNQEKLDDLGQLNNVVTCKFDATDEGATIEALNGIEFDIAVINAGTCEYVDVKQIEPDMFRRVFEINVFGAINVVYALLQTAKKGDKLVFVDSLARLLPFTRSQAYGSSKAALHYIAKSFEVDLASRGVKVQSISPGFVKTPLTDRNDFKMPMAITAEQAAVYMLDGILSDKSSVYFPKRFSAFIRLLNLMPEFIQRKMCISMRSNTKRKR